MKEDFKFSLSRRGNIGSGNLEESFKVLERSGGAKSWRAQVFRQHIQVTSVAPQLRMVPAGFGALLKVMEKGQVEEVNTLVVLLC